MTNRHPRVQDFATDFDHTDAAWVTVPPGSAAAFPQG